MSYIAAGKKEGAKLEVGGNCIGSSGFFIQPTVFSDVTDDMKISREEVWKPIGEYFFEFSLSTISFPIDFRSSSIDFEVQNIRRSYRSS